jgi:hypothetical protein
MLFIGHNAYLIGNRTLGAFITFGYPWFKKIIIIIKIIYNYSIINRYL